jgi:uncharacterized RDD family membrane protein YckC
VAVLIDTGILVVVGVLSSLAFGTLGLFSFGVFPTLVFGPFVWWVIGLVYFTFFEGTSGQTWGKQLVGIKVVDESSQRPPPIEQAMVRNIVRIIDWLPFLYIIGFILVETQPNNKRLGDIIAGTIVVRDYSVQYKLLDHL